MRTAGAETPRLLLFGCKQKASEWASFFLQRIVGAGRRADSGSVTPNQRRTTLNPFLKALGYSVVGAIGFVVLAAIANVPPKKKPAPKLVGEGRFDGMGDNVVELFPRQQAIS